MRFEQCDASGRVERGLVSKAGCGRSEAGEGSSSFALSTGQASGGSSPPSAFLLFVLIIAVPWNRLVIRLKDVVTIETGGLSSAEELALDL